MNKFQLITNEVKKVINGKDRAIVTTLLALLTGGNILIEDIPGVGKTTMAVAFAEGRDYIVPRDVQNIFICTVNHRIILNAKASASKKNSEEILQEILRKTPKPRT